MILRKEDKLNFKTADKCHICNIKYNKEDIKVRDHCHITGKYRGSAHQKCNFSFRLTDKIPVVFHNLKGYDSVILLCRKLVNLIMDINVIPCNFEKYMSFMLGRHVSISRFISIYEFIFREFS